MNGAELIEAGAEISWCDCGWLCSNFAQTSNMHWCYSESETTAREQSWKRLGHFGFSLGMKHERRTWSSTNKINEFENVLQSCSAVRGLWEKDAVRRNKEIIDLKKCLCVRTAILHVGFSSDCCDGSPFASSLGRDQTRPLSPPRETCWPWHSSEPSHSE